MDASTDLALNRGEPMPAPAQTPPIKPGSHDLSDRDYLAAKPTKELESLLERTIRSAAELRAYAGAIEAVLTDRRRSGNPGP